MINSNVLAVVAISSTMLATPVLAQTPIHDSGISSLHREADLSVAPLQQMEKAVVGREAHNALVFAQTFHPSMAGKETTTRPWTAPVGHRQPRVIDVPASSVSQSFFEQEDADVDRKISGVCRGC